MGLSNKTHNLRCADNFRVLLREMKLEYIRKGKNPPSDAELTRKIANRIKKEAILYNEFIPFD